MNALIDAAISHARTVVSALVLILVAGAIAYNTVPKEADPDINIPVLYVNVSLEGISPEDSERLLIKPIEQEMRGIDGVKEMRSIAFQGGGNVVLEFDAGFDPDIAVQDVRDKLDLAKAELPEGCPPWSELPCSRWRLPSTPRSGTTAATWSRWCGIWWRSR